jgi:hypothetical protein
MCIPTAGLTTRQTRRLPRAAKLGGGDTKSMRNNVRCNANNKGLKIESEKEKERINVFSRSRLCNTPLTILGIVYKWLMCVYSEVHNANQSAHFLTDSLVNGRAHPQLHHRS